NSNSYLRDILGDILGKDMYYPLHNTYCKVREGERRVDGGEEWSSEESKLRESWCGVVGREEARGLLWKVIQNGNSKKIISTGKDGIVRVLLPVTAAEIQARMNDAKEIWEAIRTRFDGNANSKKMQKAVFKQQFEAFKISNSEGLEKAYDRFQQLLSQLEAHGAEVSTEDANHKFLIYLPPAWSNLAMTMTTNPEIDTLSIDDLYNNLRVFEQEIQVKSGFIGAYSTCTSSTSSTNVPEKEVLASFADEVIYSLFAKQSETAHFMKILEQIDDVDIE
ncbi:hypothetical protein Tco_0978655, partial [Tanacetum coccineum]